MNYAGFGKRLLAYLIDGVIIGLAGGILAVFFGYYFYLIFGWLLGALYFILMEGGTWQATLGKRAMGLIDSQVSWEVCLFSDLRDRLSDGSIYGESSGTS